MAKKKPAVEHRQDSVGEEYLTDEQLRRVDDFEARADKAKSKGQRAKYDVIMAEWAQLDANTNSRVARLGSLAEPFGTTTIHDDVATIGGAKIQAALEALDEDSRKAFAIAQAAGKTVDVKMREICDIDRPKYLAWKSPQWSKFLGVSEAAVKQTDFWKIDRKKAIGAYQVIAEENAIDMDD